MLNYIMLLNTAVVYSYVAYFFRPSIIVSFNKIFDAFLVHNIIFNIECVNPAPCDKRNVPAVLWAWRDNYILSSKRFKDVFCFVADICMVRNPNISVFKIMNDALVW